MKRTIKFNLFPKKVGVLVECRPIRMRVCYAWVSGGLSVGYIEPVRWNEEEGRYLQYKNRFRQTAGEKINMAITACEEQIEAILPVSNCWKRGADTELKRLWMKRLENNPDRRSRS